MRHDNDNKTSSKRTKLKTIDEYPYGPASPGKRYTMEEIAEYERSMRERGEL